MAAIKQTLAIAIAVWAIPKILEDKRIVASIIIIIASLIHPYVIVYFVAFILKAEIFNKKTYILIGLTIIAAASFSSVVDTLINVTSNIGDVYQSDFFADNGISYQRLLVYFVTPILAFIGRFNIKEKANNMVLLSINLSIVSSCFMILASLGGANLFGRMANYFDIFQCIALPSVIHYGFPNKRTRKMITMISIPCFLFFYYIYYSKYLSLGPCFYGHISIWELLKG